MNEINLKKVLEICKERGLLSQNRKRNFTLQKYAVYNFLSENTKMSLLQMAKLIGDKDHSNVVYGLKLYKNLSFIKDKNFLNCIKEVEETLSKSLLLVVIQDKRPLPTICRTNNFRAARVKVKSFNYEDNN